MMNDVFNTLFEVSLRALLVLETAEYQSITSDMIAAVDFITVELYEVENEEESSQTQFDIKAHFDTDIRAAFDEILTRLLTACKYDGFSSVYFSLRDFDVVVNGNLKDSFGKGYRAFLNTIMSVALMEYLNEHGKYAPGLLIVDSPILSLKEKVSDEGPTA